MKDRTVLNKSRKEGDERIVKMKEVREEEISKKDFGQENGSKEINETTQCT